MFRQNSKKLVIDLTKPQQDKARAKLEELTGKKWEFIPSLIIKNRDRSAFRVEVEVLDPLERTRLQWEKNANSHGIYIETDYVKKGFKRVMDKKYWLCYEVNIRNLLDATEKDIFPQGRPKAEVLDTTPVLK